MSEEDQIEEILEEANAYNMRKEVDERAKIHLKNDPLFSKLEAYIYAYMYASNLENKGSFLR